MSAPPAQTTTTTPDLGVIVHASIKRKEDADQALAELSSKAKIHEVEDLSTLTQIDLDEALKLIHPTFAGKLREPLKQYIKPASLQSPPAGSSSELHEEIKRLKAQVGDLTVELQELALKNATLQSWGGIMQILTQSSATIYKQLCPKHSTDVLSNLPQVAVNVVNDVWEAVKKENLKVPTSGSPEQDYQDVLETLMDIIEEFVPSSMVFYAKPNLISKVYNGAVQIPDGSFNHEHALATWDMTTLTIEVKQRGSETLVHQGIGDVISYMMNMLREQYGSEKAIEAEGFGVFTNIATISVLRVGKGFEIERSATLPLLVDDTAEYGAAPEGLKALMRLYAAPPTTLGNHVPPVVKNIILGNRGNTMNRVAVDCHVGSGTNTVVYAAEKETTAVKISTEPDNTFKWQTRVAKEVSILQILEPEQCRNIPQIRYSLQDQVTNHCALCITPVGVPLRTSNNPTQQLTVIRMVVDGVTSALAAAQKHNLCHNDIHPGNIVVAGALLSCPSAQDLNPQKHHICLVDWELAMLAGSTRNRFTGIAFYISDQILSNRNNATCSYKDDFESLIYLCVYLLEAGALPWAEAKNLQELIAARKKYMTALKAQAESPQHRFILNLWSHKDDNPLDYDIIRNELQLSFVGEGTEKPKSIRSRRKRLPTSTTTPQ
jgi:hypothetical protein